MYFSFIVTVLLLGACVVWGFWPQCYASARLPGRQATPAHGGAGVCRPLEPKNVAPEGFYAADLWSGMGTNFVYHGKVFLCQTLFVTVSECSGAHERATSDDRCRFESAVSPVICPVFPGAVFGLGAGDTLRQGHLFLWFLPSFMRDCWVRAVFSPTNVCWSRCICHG